jgi:hypothetical protein
MTSNEKALISAAVKVEALTYALVWHTYNKKCLCEHCNLTRAVRRVVKERRGK